MKNYEETNEHSFGAVVTVIVIAAMFAIYLWAINHSNQTEVNRLILDVESVSHEGGFLEGHRTVLRLKGGGVYVLSGIRNVPSGKVQVSERLDGSQYLSPYP